MASENNAIEMIEQQANEFASPECEQNILRRMLKNREDAEVAVEELTDSDFTVPNLAQLFECIRDIVQDGGQIDLGSVDSVFSRKFPIQADAIRDAMVGLVERNAYTLTDSQDVKEHIRIVRDLSRRRTVIRKMEYLTQLLKDPTKDVTETLTAIQDAAESTDDAAESEWTSLDTVNLDTYEYLDARQTGKIRAITTGVTSVDNIIGGLFGGELTIVAARPSVGKSAFGLNIALSAAREGFKVGFVSCEMDAKGFGQRTLSRGSWVDGGKLRKGQIEPDDWTHLSNAMLEMQELKVDFLFNRNTAEGITIESVFRDVRRKARRGEIDLLIVDYIGIMKTVKTFREDRLRVGYISSELKRLAMVANIPVVALCQVNRMAQGRLPTMAELRDSGAVEQDADGILFLHRPDSHEDKSIHPRDVKSFYSMQDGGNTYIAISIAKQRNGATGITQVMFDPNVMRYSEIMRESE